MKYYRESVTSLSFEFLKELKKEFRFVLIGGWAVWLYTKQLKSKDIDIVVDLSELAKLKGKYAFSKNERLKKYEFRRGEVQVDVYSVYYSDIGMKAEEIIKNCHVIEGLRVPKIEVLVALKAVAFMNRKGSAKGRKDFLDLVSLLGVADKNLSKYLKDDVLSELVEEIKLTTKIPELSLNNHQVAREKKKWLSNLGR